MGNRGPLHLQPSPLPLPPLVGGRPRRRAATEARAAARQRRQRPAWRGGQRPALRGSGAVEYGFHPQREEATGAAAAADRYIQRQESVDTAMQKTRVKSSARPLRSGAGRQGRLGILRKGISRTLRGLPARRLAHVVPTRTGVASRPLLAENTSRLAGGPPPPDVSSMQPSGGGRSEALSLSSPLRTRPGATARCVHFEPLDTSANEREATVVVVC